jgi:hypothetical protein
VEPVVLGNSQSGLVSDCKLTQRVTMVDTLTIEEDILIHSTTNREIDQYLGGDPDSNLALMHLLFPEFKKYQRNLAALDAFDLVEVDAKSLKSYIYWLAVEAQYISCELKDQALRQARIVLAISSLLEGHFPQRRKPSDFGCTY